MAAPPPAASRPVFGALYAAEGTDPEVLRAVACDFSPRLDCGSSGREVVLDLSGSTRLFGDTRTIAGEIRRTAADRGLQVRVAIAGTRTAARLLVRHRAGVTTVAPGEEAAAVAALPIEAVGSIHEARSPADDAHELVRTLKRWGVRTLGALAALPVDDVAARLGQAGVRIHRLAHGDDPHPLVPYVPEERFEEAFDLEWPIEGLEPLSFVLGRLLEPLAAHLERRHRGAAVLRVHLHLVTRDVHERALQLPVALRDARTLRTLMLLDLDAHPPPAAIDRVVVSVDPAPARVVQFSLLARPLPSPEQLSTLMARLQALMGETRCGSPALVDDWEPGAFAMHPFAPASAWPDAGATRRRGGPVAVEPHDDGGARGPVWALRRFRTPIAARVRVEHGVPVRVTTDVAGLAGGRVQAAAGPWRTSGKWWMDERSREEDERVSPKRRSREGGWDRDEWDVTLAEGTTCRIFRARDTDAWFMEAMVD